MEIMRPVRGLYRPSASAVELRSPYANALLPSAPLAKGRSALARRPIPIAALAFLLIVVVPTACSILYYGVLASDRFVSEASFMVRSAKQPLFAGLGSFLQMTGMVRSQDDAYSVQDYLLSRDAVTELERKLSISKMFGAPEGDMLARYPSPIYGSTSEELHQFYKTMVQVSSRADTGLTTIRVQAFRPGDAETIARGVLDLGEQFIRKLNERIRSDAVRFAQDDVTRSEKRLVDAQLAVTAFRNREMMVDPGKSSLVLLEIVGRLSSELVRAKTQLREVTAAAPTSPQVQGLRTEITALEEQIVRERGRATGSDGLADKIAEFEQLNFNREFAAKALAASMTGLEAARNDARRQQLYLEPLVSPHSADYSLEPRRARNVLVTLFASGLLFLIGWLFATGVREHATHRQ